MSNTVKPMQTQHKPTASLNRKKRATLRKNAFRSLQDAGMKVMEPLPEIRESMLTTFKNQIFRLVSKLTEAWAFKSPRGFTPVASGATTGQNVAVSLPTEANQSCTNAKATPAETAPESAETKATKFDGARMTSNRLQSLDGSGYRECYMDKLRQVASESEPAEGNREYWFTQSGTKIPGIRKAIPTRARVTSTQLQAYVEGLPKETE